MQILSGPSAPYIRIQLGVSYAEFIFWGENLGNAPLLLHAARERHTHTHTSNGMVQAWFQTQHNTFDLLKGACKKYQTITFCILFVILKWPDVLLVSRNPPQNHVRIADSAWIANMTQPTGYQLNKNGSTWYPLTGIATLPENNSSQMFRAPKRWHPKKKTIKVFQASIFKCQC